RLDTVVVLRRRGRDRLDVYAHLVHVLQPPLDRRQLRVQLLVLLALAVGGALGAVPRDRIGRGHLGLLGQRGRSRRLHVAVQIYRQSLVAALDELALGGAARGAAAG